MKETIPMRGADLFAAVAVELRGGRPVLVADSADRENEVDAIVAAETVTTQWMGWMVRHTSGYLCAPLPADRADKLGLPVQWADNQDPKHTCYTVSCDAATGVSTGISAADRQRTLRVLADPTATPTDLIRPGHILPLRARPGGVAERAGHTEAAVDLCRLAGLNPVGGIGELVFDDGSMMRYPDAQQLAAQNHLLLITIEELLAFLGEYPHIEAARAAVEKSLAAPSLIKNTSAEREETGQRVKLTGQAKLPIQAGEYQIYAFQDQLTGAEHVALVADKKLSAAPDSCPLVRIHSECLTGEAFGSRRCDCGPQLQSALQQIAETGGAVVYLRGHEGRGIGLGEKIRAYALQDAGADTAQANLDLGWPIDLREYGAAAAILNYLGYRQIRLLTNNPAKIELDPELVTVVERVPLEVGFDPCNLKYLQTKKALGHWFDHLDSEEK